MSDDPRQALLRRAEEQRVAFVNLQFTDILGMVKNVTIPIHELPDALDHGVWFDGSSIEGFARIVESDMYLVPDLSTYALVPWDQHEGLATARLICNIYTPDGKPFAGDPRHVLAAVTRQAGEMGFAFNVAPEIEFFLFKTDAEGRTLPLPHDHAGYFDVSTDLATLIRRQMVRALQSLDITVEAAHHEVAAGQHEIDLRYAEALRAADQQIVFRETVRACAAQHGLLASFAPKIYADKAGNGAHLHLSLAREGASIVTEAGQPRVLSAPMRAFMAGILEHLPALMALTTPSTNSFKRIRPRFWSGAFTCWGMGNREAALRVPMPDSGLPVTNVELKTCDATANPYLALGAVIAAGLDGIDRQLPLGDAVRGDPADLSEAERLERRILPLP
ncbi:MAG: glutamine synthetase family protein, partial [Chloroflexaceae bacterium]